jgi:hypothetical protein
MSDILRTLIEWEVTLPLVSGIPPLTHMEWLDADGG